MLLESFRITFSAVAQIFILAAIGYFLVKKNILGKDGLNTLSRLLIQIILPLLIFSQLIRDFSFSRYPNWWVFPLISAVITLVGLGLGGILGGFIKDVQKKMQFLSLIAFQNAGYLPLALIAALFPKEKADTLFIYLFLFLLGFNIVVWSLGVYMLTFSKAKKFELGSLFSPPVIAILLSLVIVFFGWNKFMPEVVIRPLKMIGDCTLPLAMFVVGGSLAEISLGRIDKMPMILVVTAKSILMPLLGLFFITKLRIPELMALLILIELAVPSANSLSVIIRHYRKDDLFISQGIFVSHILSLITIPLFLSLYFALNVIK